MAGEGLPDPEAGLRWAYLEGATDYFYDEREPGYRVWELRLKPVLRAAPTGHDLLDELLREPLHWSWDEHGQAMCWWPAILPSHREVVAVNYLPHLGVYPACVRGLIDADGPAGDATAIVLAQIVAARNPEAASLLVRMAARGGLPAETVGRQLALLMRRTHVEPRPVMAVLAEAARVHPTADLPAPQVCRGSRSVLGQQHEPYDELFGKRFPGWLVHRSGSAEEGHLDEVGVQHARHAGAEPGRGHRDGRGVRVRRA
ncbi:hypothetical protein SAMN05216276_1006197 [Streptosporangium subroseum]|uniref:Uncharacterized protein n=1 Tax=Streptosporangium subroseum TaxID=106412 RepID=A0A239D0A0_9ACTN|nr:hypothetical protein [Streptosporangium subroseum]SNS25946.1 hypothetical protein SAMN05216276_1006197 [Streptosporangium subroseum]